MKLPNSRYQKVIADWFRTNVKKPNDQVFDIQNDDFFLVESDRPTGRTQWRGIVYGELYEIRFTPVHSATRGVHARMTIHKQDPIFDETVKVSAR